MHRRLVLMAALLSALAREGSAQNLEFHSCTVQAGGGFSLPRGADSRGLSKSGWLIGAGGGFATSERFAIVGNFLYQQSSIPGTTLQQQPGAPAGGKAQYYTAMLEPTWILTANHHFNYYVLGGFGWLRRAIKFTRPDGTLTNPGNTATGSAVGNSGAFDGGMGINVRLGRSNARAFAEGRYLRGLAQNSGTTLIPIAVGVRW